MRKIVRKRIIVFAPALLLFSCGLCRAHTILGDWLGTIRLGAIESRIVLHVGTHTEGGYIATLDDVDHGEHGIPVNSLVLDESKMGFLASTLSASYQGKVSADGATIEGIWSQGVSLPVIFRRITAPPPIAPQPVERSDIDGTWVGRIAAPDGARLVFHLFNTEGGLSATVDSPDQNLVGWPVPLVERQDANLRLELKQVGAVFVGKISPDLSVITGAWGSTGNEWPLVLNKVETP